MKNLKSLAAMLVMLMCYATMSAQVASGTCGSNLTWSLSQDGVLVIEGTGEMDDNPWIYEDKSQIKSVVIEEGVTSISRNAFMNSTNLTHVTISNGVTFIDDNAFQGCSSLTSITIPNSVTGIGHYAFGGCTSLTSITIPKNVKNIGYSPFAECSNLVSIIVEDGNTIFDSRDNCNAIIHTATNNLIQGCSTTIIPDGITSIEESAFAWCNTLVSLTIPNSVTNIGNQAFEYCSNLSEIILGEGLKNIGTSAFVGCSSLETITCKAQNPPTFDYSDFPQFDTNLSVSVFVPKNSVEVYQTADVWKEFTNIQSIVSIIASGTCGSKLTWNLMDNGVLVIEGTGEMKDYALNIVAPWSSYIANITSVIIREGVTSIGNSAFSGCSSLTSIILPEGVTSIGDCAFYNCSGLTSIILPEGVTSIGDSAFNGCSSLTSIILPEGVTSIGERAFYNCSSLTSITIPEGVTSIENHTFYGCSSLTAITIPASVTSIGNDAFRQCDNLTDIHIGSIESWLKINYKNYWAHPNYLGNAKNFYLNGEQITEVDVPTAVKSIPSYAFYNCKSLVSINMPEGLTSIGEYAFSNCKNLVSINMPEGLTSIGEYAFYNCKSLVSINIPDGVPSIGQYTFYNCSNLTSITLPNSMTSIGYNAFNYCSGLISITIPKSVTYISEDAFSNCIVLKEVVFVDGSTPLRISQTIFKSSPIETLYLGRDLDYSFTLNQSTYNPFYNNITLTFVTIGDSVTSIADYAFYGCSNLTSVTLPESVTSIGTQAFYNACEVVYVNATTPPTLSSSSSFILDYGVLVVPESAYEIYCTADIWMDDVLRKKIVTKEDYKKVVNLTAKEDVSSLYETIGEARLPRVVDLTISGSINSYDFFVMLTKMTALRHLDLTDATIVANAFCHYQTYSTQDNVFPDFGLYNCKLRSIKLPKSLIKINQYALAYNPLKEVAIPEGVTSIGEHAFHYCSNLASIIIPEGVTTINGSAFSGCSMLNKVVLPPTIKSIGNYAFSNCNSLREIRIPSSVRSVGDNAFSSCLYLDDVYVYTIEPINIAQNTFTKSGNNFIGTLHAPKVSYTNYYFDTQWGQFLKFAEFDEPYDNFYVEGDKEFNDSTGSVGGTPDVEMGDNSGIIVDGDTIKQDLGDVDIEHDGCHGGSIIVGGNGHIHAGKLHFHIHIKAGKWYFFCFPFDIKKKDIFCQGGADWIFRYYDGEERANNGKGGWKNVTSDGNGNHLKAAVGYIFQASKDDILELIVDEKDFKKEDKYNKLVAHAASNKQDASWNFVGNPYLSYYEITRDDYSAPITVWDGSKYKAIRPGDDDYILNPFEAFFVQKPEDDSQVSYNSDNQLTYLQSQTAAANARARRREQAIDPDRLLVNISLTDGEETDQTRVVFNNNAAMDYEAACDAAKFSTAGVPQLYTIDSRAVRYAINERPVAEGIVTMGYSVPVQGNYILSAPRMDTPIAVKDNLTGTVHHFAEGNYVFASEAGTFDDRFTVLMESATGIDNAELGKEKSEMYNIKGQHVENANEQGIYIKDSRKVVKL